MTTARTLTILASVALACSLPAMGQVSSPSGSRRPLPHPDILNLPVENEPAAPAVAPVNASESNAAAAPLTGSETMSSEDKPIVRREDQASAAMPGRDGRTITRREGASRPGLLRDLWPLLAVLALIAAMVFLLKKFMPARRLMAGSQVLQIVAQTHVTAKHQLMLVKLGRSLVLLGVSADRMCTLRTIDDPEQVALILGQVASAQPHSMTRDEIESMQEEAVAYADVPEDDPAAETHGQLHGLLKKVRKLAGKTDAVVG